MLVSVFKKITTSPSRTFALLAAMFCFGILVGPLAIGISTSVFGVLLAICLLSFSFIAPSPFEGEGGGRGVTSASSRNTFRILCLALFFLVLGLFCYQQSEIPKNIPTVRDFTGSQIRIEGDVIAESSIKTKSQQVTIGRVKVADVPVFGNVLVTVLREQSIAYGDHLVFSCSMQIPRPFSGFAYDRFLQAKGTFALCRFPHDLERAPSNAFSLVASILTFKRDVVSTMKHVFPEPHASFLFGLVFGGNVGLERTIQDEFRETGMSHILAASGFNVSLFTFVFFGWIVQHLGRKRGAIATAILLAVYVIMAGATAAVVRAAIFGGVLLIGSMIGRRASIVNTLLLTASVMLFYNPRWLLDDVGFQLSFVAFAAIIFIAPRLEEKLEFVPEHIGIRNALAGSLSAIFLTLPIILWQFGSISLVAPFANVFVLPL
ncbi:hypothetical protein A3E97_04245, partial [Candidatus Uhrbacteria bacterium RIFCSPHIGHO2_12_FULL_47_12]